MANAGYRSPAHAGQALKPRPIVQIQSLLALVAGAVAILLSGRAGVLGVLVLYGLGLVLAGYLAVRYEHLVRSRERSRHRRERDGTMLRCVAAGLLIPVLLAVYTLCGGAVPGPLLDGDASHVGSIAAAGVFAAMLSSSCVDWYLIRAFRDGVLGEPACQMHAHDEETALYYARAWIAHRAVAETLGWGGVMVVLVVALVALQHSTKDRAWDEFFAYLAPAGAVYLGLGGYLAKRLRPVPGYFQRPSVGIGRWAHGKTVDAAGNEQQVDGLVVDAAIDPGLQLLPAPGEDIVQVPLAQATRLRSTQRPFCGKRCEHWIPGCERGRLEAEQADRQNSGEEAAPKLAGEQQKRSTAADLKQPTTKGAA